MIQTQNSRYAHCLMKDCCPHKQAYCERQNCGWHKKSKRFMDESNIDFALRTFSQPDMLVLEDEKAYKRLAEIEKKIFNWVIAGNNLIIFSANTGNGKTTWARRLLLSYLQDIIQNAERFAKGGTFVTMFEFLDRQRDDMEGRDEEFARLKAQLLTKDLVVWDDLGTMELSEFERSSILNIIDTRSNRKLSNIFTTNVVPDSVQMFKILGQRLHSRIINVSEVIEFKDGDKRGLKIGNAANTFKGNK